MSEQVDSQPAESRFEKAMRECLEVAKAVTDSKAQFDAALQRYREKTLEHFGFEEGKPMNMVQHAMFIQRVVSLL